MVRRNPLQTSVLYLLTIILTIFLLLPVFYILVGAFFFNASGSRTSFTFGNFRDAASSMPLLRQLINSLLVTLFQTSGQIITGILAAYALVFCSLKHSNALMMVFLFSMMIPGETTLLANYMTITNWQLIDTIPAIFLPFLVQGFNVFLLRQSFTSFPEEIRQAAMIDGANHMQFMGHILLPMCSSTILAATINSAIAAWNGYFWPLLVTNSPERRTIQIGITQLSGSESSQVGVIMAGATMAILPPLIVMMVGNRHLRGMRITGALN